MGYIASERDTSNHVTSQFLYILSVSKLICGVKTVLYSAREWIALGSLGGLVNYNWDPITLALPEEARLAFEKFANSRESALRLYFRRT